jgi:hypothetical protein
MQSGGYERSTGLRKGDLERVAGSIDLVHRGLSTGLGGARAAAGSIVRLVPARAWFIPPVIVMIRSGSGGERDPWPSSAASVGCPAAPRG